MRVGGESHELLTGVGIGVVEGGTGDDLSFPVRVRKKRSGKHTYFNRAHHGYSLSS